MTLGDLLEALAASGVTLAVREGELLYHGPRLAPDDPIRTALETFCDEVAWLWTSRRLCVSCPRELADGDRICCEVHRRAVDAIEPTWATKTDDIDARGPSQSVAAHRGSDDEAVRSGVGASAAGSPP